MQYTSESCFPFLFLSIRLIFFFFKYFLSVHNAELANANARVCDKQKRELKQQILKKKMTFADSGRNQIIPLRTLKTAEIKSFE
jgi:hypothetical protein